MFTIQMAALMFMKHFSEDLLSQFVIVNSIAGKVFYLANYFKGNFHIIWMIKPGRNYSGDIRD